MSYECANDIQFIKGNLVNVKCQVVMSESSLNRIYRKAYHVKSILARGHSISLALTLNSYSGVLVDALALPITRALTITNTTAIFGIPPRCPRRPHMLLGL